MAEPCVCCGHEPHPGDRRISIAEIQSHVAGHFGIPTEEMRSARRGRDVARPRQVAMYLAKQFTPSSLPEIGRRFGGRDHTTVIHAVRKIEQLRTDDVDMALHVSVLACELVELRATPRPPL